MNAMVELALEQIRGVWRYRWPALAVAWGVCILGWVIVLALPDAYQATARVFVDTRTTLSLVTQGLAVEPNVESQIQRVRQALLSGPQLEKVAQVAGFFSGLATPQERMKIITKLRSNIQIQGSGSTGGVYMISYKDPDRERSLRVVEQLLNTFVEGTLGGKREGSEQAQRFLETQIAEYERRLAEAEQRLADFKKENVGLMPGTQGDYFSRLQGEMEAANKARAALRIAEKRRDELQRQLQGEQMVLVNSTTPGPMQPATSNDTASRIRETQARLDELLLRFTEKHPDVIALRETLEELKARRRAEIEAVRRGDPGAAARAGLTINPVFQSIQVQLNQTEVEMAALRAEIENRERKIAELRKLVDTAPEVEAEFARLNRDYDVTRAQYNALVERLERTRLSEEAEATGIVRFEVIDPPTASFTPVAPNRPRLIVLVLLAGIGVGGGLGYLLYQLKPVFNTARQLAELTGLPVLGSVSATWLSRYRAEVRRGLVMFAAAAGSLAVACLGVLQFRKAAGQLLRSLVG